MAKTRSSTSRRSSGATTQTSSLRPCSPICATRRGSNGSSTFTGQAWFSTPPHKHVPLLEDNVVEAVTNNVGGTRNVVDAAVRYEVEHLVLISTDKAVHPTNVLGAS